ncbi:S-layer glycoprotein N-glycosyltransferase AglJ [Halosegnis sp.]|uniref:S-layer glycoprotein N-glycosyltransferase AglJ n=1 Tax=Halosegnis sp. TaxID=2864959 RepID=UPI0035D50516
MDSGDVCVLLPTMNEAATVADVVGGFREHGFENVLVVDGHSTDGTRELAREAGARVVRQRGRGKGQAVRQAVLEEIRTPVVLMADADGTYRPEDAERLLEPIESGRAEHVVGDRFADMEPGAMSRLNRVGNRLANTVFRIVHGRDLGDILSGYRAFTRASFRRYRLAADGFGIETELAVEAVKHDTRVAVVPITYRARPDESETNLNPVTDGGRIFLTLYRLAKTSNPLFYFGSVGAVSLAAGLGVAAFVAAEWFLRTPPVSHEVLAVVGAAGIILGVQLFVFGVLSDVVVTATREQTRRLEELLERRLEETTSTSQSGSEERQEPPTERQSAGHDGSER